MFDWYPKKRTTPAVGGEPIRGFFGPHVILADLGRRVPQYLDEVDQGRLVYPACKRAPSDMDGDLRSVWDHTRLEAMRYLMMIPGREFELLTEPSRQIEMIDAYLAQRPHEEIVADFTGGAAADSSVAILAGLNWLTHCAQLSNVPPAQQSGTMRNFRKVVTLAQRWWMMEGAADRCAQQLARAERPPLMLYLTWGEYTRLAKQVAAAAVFGSTIGSAESNALSAELISRFEAAHEPDDLLGT